VERGIEGVELDGGERDMEELWGGRGVREVRRMKEGEGNDGSDE